MTPVPRQPAEHFARARADLAVAQDQAMANTAAARRSVADIARAALAVAAKPSPVAPVVPAPAKRCTTATERRVKHTKALIAEFATREMLSVEICFFLGFSPSGTRKYVRILRNAGVIELARHIGGTASYIGKPVFRLSDDQGVVNAFIATLSEPRVAVQHRAVPPAAKDRKPEVPGRHLHIMGDDVPYSVRAWRGTPTRDPLVEAFFGPAGAEVRP